MEWHAVAKMQNGAFAVSNESPTFEASRGSGSSAAASVPGRHCPKHVDVSDAVGCGKRWEHDENGSTNSGSPRLDTEGMHAFADVG